MNSSTTITNTDYHTWKENLNKTHEADMASFDGFTYFMHGGVAMYEYSMHMLDLFEDQFKSIIPKLNIDDKFKKIYKKMSYELLGKYGKQTIDAVKKDGINSEPYINFIETLKDNGYLPKLNVIKQTAQLIEQDSRTTHGFFSKLKQVPDFLAQLGMYLDPNLSITEAGIKVFNETVKAKLSTGTARKHFYIEMAKAKHTYISADTFTFDSDKIYFEKNIGTHTKLKPTIILDNWINGLTTNKVTKLHTYQVFKIIPDNHKSDIKISINKGRDTCGIQIIKNSNGEFFACNNVTTDNTFKADQQQKNEMLKTVLTELNQLIKSLSQDEIMKLLDEMTKQMQTYENNIINEKASLLWVDEAKINLWEDKIIVLATTQLLLLNRIKPELLAEQEALHPRYSEGTDTKKLSNNAKKLKGLLENWDQYTQNKPTKPGFNKS